MHNKCLVADDVAITGSYNLSHGATENAENVLMIQDRDLADQYDAYVTELVRRYRPLTEPRGGGRSSDVPRRCSF